MIRNHILPSIHSLKKNYRYISIQRDISGKHHIFENFGNFCCNYTYKKEFSTSTSKPFSKHEGKPLPNRIARSQSSLDSKQDTRLKETPNDLGDKKPKQSASTEGKKASTVQELQTLRNQSTTAKKPFSEEKNVTLDLNQGFRILAIGGAGASGKLLSYRLAWSDLSPSISIIGRKTIKGAQISDRLDTSTHEQQSHEYHTVDVHKDLELLREYVRQSDLVINLVPSFDSLEIPRICVEEGVNYMDMLSGIENQERFTREFDEECKRKGIALITGASISPGLSTCMIDRYASEFDLLEEIEIVFSQGNRSIKGKSTLESMFKRIGKKVTYLEDGKLVETIAGIETKNVAFPGLAKSRLLSISMKPEVGILQKRYPSLKSLVLYSGFEQKIMQLSTVFFAYLTKWGVVSDWSKYSKALINLSGLFRWFGSYEGAIQIVLTGKKKDKNSGQTSSHQVASTIIALNGHDTQVPITPIYLLSKKLAEDKLKAGAYPCVGLFTLDEFLDSVSDFDIFEIRDGCGALPNNKAPIIAQSIGTDYWDMVPEAIRDFYSDKGGFTSGLLTVERSKSVIANFIADLLHLPSASETTRLSVESSNYEFRRYFVEEDSLHLRYQIPFSSSMHIDPSKDGLVRETYNQLTFGYSYKRIPSIEDERRYGWEYSTKKVWFSNLPLPRWLTLTPKGKVIPTASPNRWYIESTWTNPLFSKPLVKFRGVITKKQHCIGIDIGGCISTSVQENEDYLSDDFLTAPPVQGSFESIKQLVKQFGGENIYIVSQATFPVALRKSEWFGYHKFFEKTGIPRENLIFLPDAKQKSATCRIHHIKYFVDNRLEVLESIRKEIPDISSLLWLQSAEDVDVVPKDGHSKIIPCKNWNDVRTHLGGTIV